MFEQVSAPFSELTKCNWFVWELTAGSQPFKTQQQQAHTLLLLISLLYDRLQSFYTTSSGQNVPIKTQPLSETTGQRRHVCYDSSSATLKVAHFLGVRAGKLLCVH